ncbi:hypothetical protein BKA70DRAFT_1440702 [Coprinopsis sp. MPI-PUGE-AT-0042]|nr:hypothetical protein BKA70DRAFT_1440702 [Coprinopsis sp. MPI-PUGE-AT-0042]
MKDSVSGEKAEKASKVWTRGQTRFLLSLKGVFQQAQERSETKPFWPILYSKFFEKYPTHQAEQDELELEKAEDATRALQDNERGIEGRDAGKKKAKAKAKKAIEWPAYASTEAWKKAREKQLHAWFYNVTSTGRSQAPKVQVVMNPKPAVKRAPPAYQLYSRIHYDKRVKPKVDAELEKLVREGAELNEAERLTTTMRVLRETYDGETPEMKAEFEKQRKELVMKLKEDSEALAGMLKPATVEQSPAEFAQHLRVLRSVMDAFFGPVVKNSGWVFTVIGAGPDPTKPDGRISTSSYHYGVTEEKQDFFSWHPSFNETYMNPFSGFAHQVFQSVRKSRALNRQKLQEFVNQVDKIDNRDGDDLTKNIAGPSSRPAIANDQTMKEAGVPLDLPPADQTPMPEPPSVTGENVGGMSFPLLSGAAGLGVFDDANLFQGSNDINMGNIDFMGGFNASAHPASLRPFGDQSDIWSLQDKNVGILSSDVVNPSFEYQTHPFQPFTNPTFHVGLSSGGGESRPSSNLDVLPQPADQQGATADKGAKEHEESEANMAKKGRKRKARVGGTSSTTVAEAGGDDGRDERENKRARRVNKHQEMPEWMCQAKRYLERGLERQEWLDCLEKWWLWEERSASLASAMARLPVGTYRPAEVNKWLQKKEFAHVPEIDDLEAYARKPGKSGLVIVVVALKWWQPLEEAGDKRWVQAVDELDKVFGTWVS